MKNITTLLLSLIVVQGAFAQSDYSAILSEIEANSTRLSALSSQTSAQKLANHTGITLSNPEVEFHYLWSTPNGVYSRQDISISQSFDFPSAYAFRSQIADLQDASADILYKSERLNLLLSAKEICIELTYCNALIEEYSGRLAVARDIVATYQRRALQGEANAIEQNKASLNLTKIESRISLLEGERESLLLELERLNGGNPIEFGESQFFEQTIPSDFESWYEIAQQQSPVLQYVHSQIEVGEKQVRLGRAEILPSFSLGYMSENITGEGFQGVVVGLSIPMWENKNRLRRAKADLKASQSLAEDSRLAFYSQLQDQFARATRFQSNVDLISLSLGEYSNMDLLYRAYSLGELSLLEYLLESQYYYELLDDLLINKRDRELALAQLTAVLL